jgi:hypothetical protein
MAICRLAYSSTLKTDATFSSVMSVDFQRTTRRYIQSSKFLVVLASTVILGFGPRRDP